MKVPKKLSEMAFYTYIIPWFILLSQMSVREMPFFCLLYKAL